MYTYCYAFLRAEDLICLLATVDTLKLKVGMGVGDGPTRLWAYFRSDPTLGHRSSKGQSALKMPYGH